MTCSSDHNAPVNPMHAAAPCVSFIYPPMLCIGAANFISQPCTINIGTCTLDSVAPTFFVYA